MFSGLLRRTSRKFGASQMPASQLSPASVLGGNMWLPGLAQHLFKCDSPKQKFPQAK